MKKIITLISIIILFTSCKSNNNGYGYNVKQEQVKTDSIKSEPTKNIFEIADERRMGHTMILYGSTGKRESQCTAYKGEFDGHTWYVFYDNLASPSVVHDPLCKCHNHNKE